MSKADLWIVISGVVTFAAIFFFWCAIGLAFISLLMGWLGAPLK